MSRREPNRGTIGSGWIWWVLIAINAVLLLVAIAKGQPTKEQVDQLAETARKLRDQAERIKVDAHAAGREDLAQAALVIQRLGETAVSSRVLLDKLMRLPTEPPSEETAPVSSPPTAPPAGPPPPAVALEIPADAVVLSGGEVKLKSNTVYTGRANRVYAGEVRNVQLIGLKIDAHGKHDGIRLVGKIENILIANCQISGARNGIDIEARASGDFARNITIRDTVISDANTGNLSGHSQGVYVYNVDGLTIERCTIRGAGRPITIFNHGVYLSHSRNIVIRDNVIEDSSSFGLKLRSDETGGMKNVLVEGNLFDGGANGVTVGGDKKPRFAFAGVAIRGNVFRGLGRSIDGNRQAIGIDAASCDGLLIESNQFEPRALDAPHAAIRVRDLPQRGVILRGNTFEGWDKTIQIEASSGVMVE